MHSHDLNDALPQKNSLYISTYHDKQLSTYAISFQLSCLIKPNITLISKKISTKHFGIKYDLPVGVFGSFSRQKRNSHEIIIPRQVSA